MKKKTEIIVVTSDSEDVITDYVFNLTQHMIPGISLSFIGYDADMISQILGSIDDGPSAAAYIFFGTTDLNAVEAAKMFPYPVNHLILNA